MIEIQQLTEDEVAGLRQEARSSMIATPLVMVLVFLAFTLLFGMPWIVFWGCTIIVVLLFFILYQDYGKEVINKDMAEGVKLVRSGKVVEVDKERGHNMETPGNIQINVTLEDEPIPDPYPKIHCFSIYNSLLQLYQEMDYDIEKHYKELVGQRVEIEYFPYSGKVLSFEATLTK